jgi:ACS family tartrate transporter-like MFS transporter
MSAESLTKGAIEKQTIRRVTLRILPFLMVCYFVAYLDRANLGFAALTMNKDIGLSATAYGWGASIFFVSYFLFEVPSNLVLERVGARRWIAFLMVSWGLISAAMALVVDTSSFYVVRFLLGMAEAGFFPGVILYLTYWFPRAHRARIVSYFMVAQPLSLFAGSPLSGALLGLDSLWGLHGWQWLFIVEAMPAIILGFVFLLWIADKPSDAAWLPENEKVWLERQLVADGSTTKEKPALWEIMKHPKVLLFGLIYSGSVLTEYGLAYWQPTMIKAYGLSNWNTGLLNAVPYALAATGMILWGTHSDRKQERMWHVALPLFLAGTGLTGCLFLPSLPLTLIALCMTLVGCFSIKPPFWAFVTERLPAGFSAAAVAQINSMAIITALLGPLFIGWMRDKTGDFTLALIPLLVLAFISGTVALLMRSPEMAKREQMAR